MRLQLVGLWIVRYLLYHLFRWSLIYKFLQLLAIIVERPCLPSPCGPNSHCREVNGQSVCSCIESYIGSPPSCRPKCIINSECALNEACVNHNCVDPCPGSCGHSGESYFNGTSFDVMQKNEFRKFL